MSYSTQNFTRNNESRLSFICVTCCTKFPTAELQRKHMKSEFHRYNLKRRISNLPSITSEIFVEKVLKQREDEEIERKRIDEKKKKRKNKGKLHIDNNNHNENEYESSFPIDHISVNSIERISSHNSHFSLGESIVTLSTLDNNSDYDTSDVEYGSISSKVDCIHKTSDISTNSLFQTQQDSISISEKRDEDEDELENDNEGKNENFKTHCIYCNTISRTIELNITHMFQKHGMYIPEKSYLIDLNGLIKYLFEKIRYEFKCNYCSFKGKSLESILSHVLMKNHSMIPYETIDERKELESFYDYSLIYGKDSKRINKKSKLNEVINFNENDSNDIDGLEEVKEEEEEEEENDMIAYTDITGCELILPNGNCLGHRSFARYYRQHLRPDRDHTSSREVIISQERREHNLAVSTEISKARVAQRNEWKASIKNEQIKVRYNVKRKSLVNNFKRAPVSLF